MEEAPARGLRENCLHPYTRLLFASVAGGRDAGDSGGRSLLQGEVNAAVAEPEGCPFAARCPLAEERCRREDPPLRERGEAKVRCFKIP
jgi:oligopeptide/dipeptide ABC transporter ATP-binding protein